MTSFKAGESLIGKFQTDPEFRSRQIPIEPAPRHPDNGVLLTLAHGRTWPKQSYVSLSMFRVPCAALREEQQGPWSLSPESLQALDDVVAKLPSIPTAMRDPSADQDGKEGWIVVCRKRRRGTSVHDRSEVQNKEENMTRLEE